MRASASEEKGHSDKSSNEHSSKHINTSHHAKEINEKSQIQMICQDVLYTNPQHQTNLDY